MKKKKEREELQKYGGHWIYEGSVPYLCFEHHLCTPSRRVWASNSARYFAENACEVLLEKRFTKVLFHGDSYMRHIYQAAVLTLTGNYRNGSLISPDPNCEYHNLFNEKRCSTEMSITEMIVCNGKITLNNYEAHMEVPDYDPERLVLWSEGNHPKRQEGDSQRYGINDATVYSNHFLKSKYNGTVRSHRLCPQQKLDRFDRRTFWVSTHARARILHNDETYDRIKSFNLKMRQFMESGKCGPMGYIDVYNMTDYLLTNFPTDAAYMTFDEAHWGMEVNLEKVQIILNVIKRSAFS